MAKYKNVQRVSDAMNWTKKKCRELSPHFAEVQAALDAIGDCDEIAKASKKKKKPQIYHIDLAKYRQMVALANCKVEEANAIMAQVHHELNDEAVRVGVDDHVYTLNGPGGR